MCPDIDANWTDQGEDLLVLKTGTQRGRRGREDERSRSGDAWAESIVQKRRVMERKYCSRCMNSKKYPAGEPARILYENPPKRLYNFSNYNHSLISYIIILELLVSILQI